ncbi:hypothetical protein GGS21DRAFT_163830 [Xylaria nigripes]|nr:hypothetical protein GGS21DRAFT_163830 [Xylaria nigripes]
MADNSPKHWATADLDPISPSPLHPPSPIVVPALQNQADTYHALSLNDRDPAALGTITLAHSAHLDQLSRMPAMSTTYHTLNTAPDAHSPGGATGKVKSAPIAISAKNTHENVTAHPYVLEAQGEQILSKSNLPVASADTPSSFSSRVDIATSVLVNSSTVSSSSPISIPPASPAVQRFHKSLENRQVVSDAALPNVADTSFPQALNNYLPTTDNRNSSTHHIGHANVNVNTSAGDIAVKARAAGLIHNSTPASSYYDSAVPTSALLPPKPPSNGFSSIPGVAQLSGIPLPLNNGTIPAGYANATLGPVNSYAGGAVMPAPPSMLNYNTSTLQFNPTRGSLQKQSWDAFLEDERKYVLDGNWDRFPDGSRIFVGNLSSERVTKNDVFELFSKYGRLAQISLKQAYGFVQYHTAVEGQAAMDALQGVEIRGKKINLELSRPQKKAEGTRANQRRRNGDRQDGNRGQRDDYRPGRQISPQQAIHRQHSYSSNNANPGHPESNYSSERRRSLSPDRSRRNLYRHRSPSPYRQHWSAADQGLPRRHGADVPDVQFLILQNVTIDFISWVKVAFVHQGLTTDVISLDPQLTRDAVIRHQVLEGVHAVVELDLCAQERGKVSMLVFDRSAGYSEVRFDQYQDLDPSIAAQLVLRRRPQPQIPVPLYSSNTGNQYLPAQQHPTSTQAHHIPSSYTEQPYLHRHHPPAIAPGADGSQFDPAAVQKILGSLNGQQDTSQTYLPQGSGPTIDVNRILDNLKTASRVGVPPLPPATQQGITVTQPRPAIPVDAAGTNEAAQHVRDIMDQLARYSK